MNVEAQARTQHMKILILSLWLNQHIVLVSEIFQTTGKGERGVEAVRHYSPPIAKHPVYPHGLRGDDATPVTDRLAGALICLPVAPDLTEADIRYICDELCACL